MLNTMIYTAMVVILITLAATTLVATTQQAILIVMKYLTLLSCTLALLFINYGLYTTVTTTTWMPMNYNLKFNFTLDQYSMLFLPISLLITWATLEFTSWYMTSDPNIMKFSKYLMLFLLTMLTLITSNNMLQLFIGWEGMGIMSFLLIGWWGARDNANTAALQAVIYNRVGDIGLILTLAWMVMNLNTWDMELLFSHPISPLLPLLGLLLAATGKSAQFGLHPWLPAAMEGPTPVSTLLHSSTMVVAGIFLLVRLHPMIQTNPPTLTTCLCLGGLTTLFTALCACTQNDIKKIIAFSTSSQLGLMMLALGLNQPELAFMHITTHAFFKAMLFLCSGSIIHSLNDEQDIRKMGGLQTTMPITSACLTLGSMALAGAPFLAGFFTKDTIIEAMTTSTTNAWALCITMLATTLTATYSLRLTFYTQLKTPRHPPLAHVAETSPHQTRPLMRLALGSTISGLIIYTLILPTKTQTLTLPSVLKLSVLLVTILGLYYALDIALNTTMLKPTKSSTSNTSLTQLAFFNLLLHRHSSNKAMKQAQTLALQLNDSLWYETLGPIMVKTFNMNLTNKLSHTHTGLLKTYLTTFIITLTLTLLLSYS